MKKQDLVEGAVVKAESRFDRFCALVVTPWAPYERRTTGGVYGPAKLVTASGVGLAVAWLPLPDGRLRAAEPKDLTRPDLVWEPLWLDSARTINPAPHSTIEAWGQAACEAFNTKVAGYRRQELLAGSARSALEAAGFRPQYEGARTQFRHPSGAAVALHNVGEADVKVVLSTSLSITDLQGQLERLLAVLGAQEATDA